MRIKMQVRMGMELQMRMGMRTVTRMKLMDGRYKDARLATGTAGAARGAGADGGLGLLTLQRLLGLEQGPSFGLQLLVAGVELGELLLQLEDAALQPLLLHPAETPQPRCRKPPSAAGGAPSALRQRHPPERGRLVGPILAVALGAGQLDGQAGALPGQPLAGPAEPQQLAPQPLLLAPGLR